MHAVERLSEHARPVLLTAEEHVLGDVQRRYEREVLEDRLDADRARLRRVRERPLDAVDRHGSLVRAQRTGHHADHRALARAVVADQPEHLAGAQFEADVVQRGHRAEALRDPLDREDDGLLVHVDASGSAAAGSAAATGIRSSRW